MKTGLQKKTSEFMDEPQSKKLMAAHMVNPGEEAAKAALAALIGKKKTQSTMGSKGSLVTGTRES